MQIGIEDVSMKSRKLKHSVKLMETYMTNIKVNSNCGSVTGNKF